MGIHLTQATQFRYRLGMGYDKDWIDAGNRRTAYYTGLPPGAYTFPCYGQQQRWDSGTAVARVSASC